MTTSISNACGACCCRSTDCCCSTTSFELIHTVRLGSTWIPRAFVVGEKRMPYASPPGWLLLVVLAAALFRIADGCSSRSTPKPRPPQTTVRPNITFQTYACPEAYAKWYCLNGATCFSIKIGESILYNCECADGYMGQRCEFKDLDGTYLPARQRVLIETASIAGGVTVAVVFVFVISAAIYLYYRRKRNKTTYYGVAEVPPPFFCDKRKLLSEDASRVHKQTDLERGHHHTAVTAKASGS